MGFNGVTWWGDCICRLYLLDDWDAMKSAAFKADFEINRRARSVVEGCTCGGQCDDLRSLVSKEFKEKLREIAKEDDVVLFHHDTVHQW